MKRIILASNNVHKIQEIQSMLGDEYRVYGLKELGISIDVVEDGKTYQENAFIKARAISKIKDEYIIADDSGLEIKALPNILGIYSARFMGENTPYSVRFNKIHELLSDHNDKSARFVCGLALITPDKKEYYIEGEVKGRIDMPQGENNFGYDPIFFPEGYNKSFAMLNNEEKNKISHRGNAINKLKVLLKEIN